jgi:hypothetical protein
MLTDVKMNGYPHYGHIQYLFNHFFLFVFSHMNYDDEFHTKYDEWTRFFWNLCETHISSFPNYRDTSLHREFRRLTIDPPRNTDISSIPSPNIWLQTDAGRPNNHICLFSTDGVNITRSRITIYPESRAHLLRFGSYDYDYDYDYTSVIYEIVERFDDELDQSDIFTLLGSNPEYIFVLLEILGYNRSLEILNEYSLYTGVPFFNPLIQPSLTDCITCKHPLPAKSRSYVCDKEFCLKYFGEYLETGTSSETLALISAVICPNVEQIVYDYLFPLCKIRPKRLTRQFVPGLRAHVADYWKFLSVRLLR